MKLSDARGAIMAIGTDFGLVLLIHASSPYRILLNGAVIKYDVCSCASFNLAGQNFAIVAPLYSTNSPSHIALSRSMSVQL